MYDRCFVTMADAGYFPGLLACLNSVYVYHGGRTPVCVLDLGLTPQQVDIVAQHPALMRLVPCGPFSSRAGAWQRKQHCFADLVGVARVVCWIDSDCVLLSNVEDVFDVAGRGKIVVPLWVDESEKMLIDQTGRTSGVTVFPEGWASYGPHVPGKSMDWFVSSFVCMDVSRHWDLAAAWAFASRFAWYAVPESPLPFVGMGDEAVLVGCVAALNKEPCLHYLPVAEWADSHFSGPVRIAALHSDGRMEVRSRRDKEQRILHDLCEVKWWKTSDNSDRWRVLNHFQNLDLLKK